MRVLLVLLAVLVLPATAQARDGKLRDLGGGWTVSGTLDGVKPPKYRTVDRLHIDHLGPGTREGLQPLAAFTDLRELTLEVVEGVDLSPLAGMGLETLELRYVRGTDLSVLSTLPKLRTLGIFDLRDVTIPPALTLPSSLTSFAAGQDGWRETGAPLAALVDAVDWPRLTRLQWLSLSVGGLEPLAPVTVDLGFLRALPKLRYLRIERGVYHRGAAPSPYTALPRGMRQIWLDAWRPGELRRTLARRHPRAGISVSPRVRPARGAGSWTITRHRGEWITYGSVWEAFDGRYGLTEYEALRAARRLLRRADPKLLARLDFDPESAGTGISAPTRGDLVRALELLGVR